MHDFGLDPVTRLVRRASVLCDQDPVLPHQVMSCVA